MNNTLVTMQPRVITLSSSLSSSNVKSTITPGLGQNTIVKPIQSASLKTTNIPQQVVPTKVVTIPAKSNLQPVKMTLGGAVASTGQTGHTMILKKAGKIETFPVPTSTPNHVPPSLVNKNFEKNINKQEIIPNSSEKVENRIVNISDKMIPKVSSCESEGAQPVDNRLKSDITEKVVTVPSHSVQKQNQIITTVTFKNPGPPIQGSNSVSVLQQEAPDSTSSKISLDAGKLNQTDSKTTLNSQQMNNSFRSINQQCVSESSLNSNLTQASESKEIEALDGTPNSISISRKVDQDSSINSSNESEIQNHGNYPNISNFPLTPMKRSISDTVPQSDQCISDINNQNEEKIKENSSIIQEQEYPAAKKSKL